MIVYKITNKINGKVYVGQTTQVLENRVKQHINANSPLGEDIRKYGITNFDIETLAVCSNIDELKQLEKEWISKLNCKVPNGYNQSNGGENSKRRVSLVKIDPKISRKFAKWLKDYRESHSMTMQDMAIACGFSKSYFRNKIS